MRATLDRFVAPLDWIRWRLLKALGPVASRLVIDQELRVALTLVFACIAAATLATTVPIALLALGPLVLGVPHVLGDIRYLVARRRYHTRRPLFLVAGLSLLASGLTGSVTVLFVGAAVTALFAAGPVALRAGVALACASIAAAAWTSGLIGQLVFAHAHNLIGLALFWLWRPRRHPLQFAALGVFFLVIAFFLSGRADSIARAYGLSMTFTGISAPLLERQLTFGVPSDFTLRLMLLFAFLQSMHYWVWLRLLPEEDRGRRTVRTFRASLHALIRDLGVPLLVIATMTAVAVALWALVNVGDARTGYLRMAIFHGHIEVLALALFVVEGFPGKPRAKAPNEMASRAVRTR